MASKLEILQTLSGEFGKNAPEVLARIEDKIGEITIDILSQNDCRFAGLRKWQSISIVAGTTAYKLNADFASLGRHPKVVDVDENFIDKFNIVDEGEFVDRADTGGYATTRYAWIEARDSGAQGPGFYLVLATDWGETGYLKIDYYRLPTANDTEMIKNKSAVLNGVRQHFPEYIGGEPARMAGIIYSGQRKTVKESPARTTTGLMVKPPIRIQKHNKLMHKAGDGR